MNMNLNPQQDLDRAVLSKSIISTESFMYASLHSVPNSFQIVSHGQSSSSPTIYCLALTKHATTGRYINGLCSIRDSSRADGAGEGREASKGFVQVELASLAQKASRDPGAAMSDEAGEEEEGKEEDLSREEELRRERQRTRVEGITSFQLFEDRWALVPRGSSIFLYDLQRKELINITEHHDALCNTSLFYGVTPETIGQSKMDAKFSPDGTMVSFICNGDIYLHQIATHRQVRITYAAEIPGVSTGIPEYVMQEEFDRYTGYWWNPSGGSSKNGHQIAYLEVDERCVPIVKIGGIGFDRDAEEFRFPRPGDPNAMSTLNLVGFDSDIFDSFDAKSSQCDALIQKHYPWCEYITRIGWYPTKAILWMQILDREQKRVAYISIDVESMQLNSIMEESTELFINVTDVFHVFGDGSDRIILGSERSGFHHLYLYERDHVHGGYYCANQITNGDWMVGYDKIWVDYVNELVYFTGTRDTPLENHVYAASFGKETNGTNGNGGHSNVTRVTPPGYFFSSVDFCQHTASFVASYSNLDTKPRVGVFKKSPTPSGAIVKSSLPMFHLACDVQFDFQDTQDDRETVLRLNHPELFHFVNVSGDVIHGCIYKPFDHNPHRPKPYPVIQYVYGGPGVQLVTNQYSMYLSGRLQFLSSLGFVIVLIDGRGSSSRGLQFEGCIQRSMGSFELDDSKEGICYLSQHRPDLNLDLSRVGIFGFSYGGYMSLMAICQHSDFYRCAIAGAPVTDWSLYDSAYTERYMGLPNKETGAYAAGSVMNHVNTMPCDEDRLMLVHGMLDENVHFRHTEVLVEKLISQCKPYQIKIYPYERHGIRQLNSQTDYQLSLIRFFQKALM